jgi:hypothetical protein
MNWAIDTTASTTPPDCHLPGLRVAVSVPGLPAVLVTASVVDPVTYESAAAGEILLEERLRRASRDELPAGPAPAALARMLFTVNYGLAVQAAGGASAAELHDVADAVLSGWPSPAVRGEQ